MNNCLELEMEKDYGFGTDKNYGSPVFAGTLRFLLGLAVLLAGIYLALLTDVRGHGLGYLLILGSPLFIMKDGAPEAGRRL